MMPESDIVAHEQLRSLLKLVADEHICRRGFKTDEEHYARNRVLRSHIKSTVATLMEWMPA